MMNNQEMINYYKEGNSLAAVQRKFDITPYQFKKILKTNNIHIRNRHEQCILENQHRGYKINHNYFDTLDNKKVYWLGFIAADGTVRKNNNSIKIGLQEQDEELLIQLKKDLQSEAPIRHYTTNDGYKVVEFVFSSAKIKQVLMYYSIVPNKTYIGISMKNIPEQYKMAFIKGFFDGDGSYTCGKVKITSKTEGILKEIQSFLNQKSSLYYTSRNLYSLELSTIPSLYFLHDIYSLDTFQLSRKYNHYLEYTK